MEADGTGTITSHNLYGANLISRSTQGKSYYYLYNAHGDVVMLMNTATGTIAGTYRYDAFGNVIMQTGNVDNSITYAGYQFDEESGLYYLNARYYDSSMARFLTEDTFRGNYEDPLSLNRYTYCHNNPIAYSDPSGHFIVGILVGGLIGGLVGGGIELVNQKFIQKKEKVDWKAVGYEAGAGALFGAVGGALGGVASGVTKTVGSVATKTTLKGVATKAVTTGLTEAVEGFATDVGRQVIVDGKSLDEVDYGQAVKTGAISGVAGAGGYAIGAAGKATKSVAKNAGSTLSEAVTKNVDDAVNEVDSAIVKSVSKSNTADVAVVKKNSVTKTGTATVSSTKTAATTKTTSTAKQTGNTIKTNGDVVTSGKSGTSSRNVAVASINEVKAKSLESGSKPIGATYEGTIYRSVNSKYDPLEMSQYTVNSNHRYTESGVPGLYFSSGEKIVKAELGNYDVFDFSNRTMYSYDVRLKNMLDVSNPSVRSQMGISLESIVGESYDVTHAVGRYAYSNGYNGIIAPSARADGGINIILFNAKGVK